MHVAVTGASGLIGSSLVERLRGQGHEVFRFVRREPSQGDELPWNPSAGELDPAVLSGIDGVIHLAGESIAGGFRWSEAKKRRILESRTRGTDLVARSIATAVDGPKVLVSASAIGFYGDRGDDWLAEDDAPGDLFISEVCVAWEKAAEPAREAGVRVVHPRIGIVLDPEGGALGQMLPPFRAGLGGKIGSGKQWMSWIALEDVVDLLAFCLLTDTASGPVNAVSPNPVVNDDFVRTLGRVIGRPTILPLPGFAAKTIFGQLGDELLLASTRVRAAKAQSLGFRFRQPDLEAALRATLQR